MEDFNCLVCGNDMPKKKQHRRKRGDHYGGDYEYDVDIYDLSTDNYFVRIENPEILTEVLLRDHEIQRANEQAAFQNNVEAFTAEIKEKVPDEKYRTTLLEAFIKEESGKMMYTSFYGFSKDDLDWFGMPFEECDYYQPRYSAHGECISLILGESDKQKYVVDGDAMKILRAHLEMPYIKFAETFGYLVKDCHLPDCEKGNVKLEVMHFSEY